MKKSILAITVVFALASVSVFATGTGDVNSMGINQKAAAIQSARTDANNAAQALRDNVAKYNNDRSHYTAADGDTERAAYATLRSSAAKIAAIQHAPVSQPATATYSEPAKTVSYSGVTQRPATVTTPVKSPAKSPAKTVGQPTPVDNVPAGVVNVTGQVKAPVNRFGFGNNGGAHNSRHGGHHNAASADNNGQANANASRGAGRTNAGGVNHY